MQNLKKLYEMGPDAYKKHFMSQHIPYEHLQKMFKAPTQKFDDGGEVLEEIPDNTDEEPSLDNEDVDYDNVVAREANEHFGSPIKEDAEVPEDKESNDKNKEDIAKDIEDIQLAKAKDNKKAEKFAENKVKDDIEESTSVLDEKNPDDIEQSLRSPASTDNQSEITDNASAQPNKYGNLMQRYKDALGKQNTNQSLNDIGKALYAGSLGGRGVQRNPMIENLLEKEGDRANQPIQNFITGMQIEGQDPDSLAAKSYRDAMSKTLGINTDKLQNLNIEQMEKFSSQFGKITSDRIKALATQKRYEVAQQQAQTSAKKEAEGERHNKTQEELNREKLAAMKDAKNQAQQDKSKKQQDDTLNKTKQILESARGNPAVGQAEKDMYAAQKANSLATLYGDPNKLSPQQVSMLASEVGKIASGGVPAMHELDAITPSTLQGKLARVWGNLRNHPTAANAGEFIKQYQAYANALTKDAQKVINDKYGRVIESSKNQLGPDNYAALKEQYLNRFGVDTNNNPTNGQVPKQQNAPTPQGTPAPKSGPQVGDVEDGYRFKGGDPSNQNNWEKAQQ